LKIGEYRIRVWLFAGVCLAVGGSAYAQGLWQGATYPRLVTGHRPLATPATKWLVLDTGGSGGGFGKGDIRQKLHDVHFWDNRVGWACGYAGVFRTQDGGLTWTRMKAKGGWYHIEMSGPGEVWLLEGFHGRGKARLWHTTDDGQSWQEVAPDTFRGYTDLYCRGYQRWLLCSGFPSYRSEDGGVTWERAAFRGGGLHRADKIAIPADVGSAEGFVIYVVGGHGQDRRLVKSLDGGLTWTHLESLPPAAAAGGHRARMFFSTSRQGWVAGPGHQIWRTDDGGESWQPCHLPEGEWATALWFDRCGHGFAAEANHHFLNPGNALYETIDGGATWTAVMGGLKQINAIFARGPRRVWAVGDVPGFIQNDLVLILEEKLQ
jgi:photosystem II stability/assembly factor-like uncharacterized protein